MSESQVNRQTQADQLSVELADWDGVISAFHDLFDDLGDIRHDGVGISFTSRAPDVATGLTLRRDGQLIASMPLHGVEAQILRLRWDDERTWIQLESDGISYTYRIPFELLRHRDA